MKKLSALTLFAICLILILSCNNKVTIISEKNTADTVKVEKPSPPDSALIPDLNGKIEIKVVFTKNPTSATANFSKLKYNKSKAILMEFDDAALTVTNAYQKLSNTFYTDGCGNNKNYSLGLAVNGRNQYNNQEIGLYNGFAATYAERLPLIQKGMDIMNHSYYHNEDGNFNNGKDRLKNVRELDEMILLKERYKMNTLIVPSDYAGFHKAASAYGYIGGASQGTFDDFVQIGKYNPKNKLSDVKSFNYLAIRRAFSDDWSNNGAQWELVNSLFADNTFDFFEIGTHGIKDPKAVQNFNQWIDNIVSKSKDKMIFCSLREFLEYSYVKDHVTKKEKIDGNTLTIALDYSTVLNKNISWYDLSLLVNSDKTISSVSINNKDFSLSYNKAGNLINISKRKIKW
nr:hypothetical protein [Pedobacter panaciterrae]